MSDKTCYGPVTDGEHSRPFCRLATEVAVERKALLDEIADLARNGREGLSDKQILARIIERASAEDCLIEVSQRELVVTIIRALQTTITADADLLCEQAMVVGEYIGSDGWLVVKTAGAA